MVYYVFDSYNGKKLTHHFSCSSFHYPLAKKLRAFRKDEFYFAYFSCVILLALNRLFWQHLHWQWTERELFGPSNTLNIVYLWCSLCIQFHRQNNQPCLNHLILVHLSLVEHIGSVLCQKALPFESLPGPQVQWWYQAKEMLLTHL